MIPNDTVLRDSDIDSMKKHNIDFDYLLNTYVDNTRKNLNTKLELKKSFFKVCIKIMMLISILMAVVTLWALKFGISGVEMISVIIGNIGAFLTTFIVLPQTIADYLFNNEEEKNMVEIIKNIQEHDKDIRNRLEK